MTLQSSCQALTSSKHAPISCLGKDSPTLNLLITHIFKCSAASWHSLCQSGPGPLTQPCDYLSYLVVFCQCRDPPLPFFRYSCQCQLPWASLEQGGESLGGNCALKKSPWKQRLSLPSPPDSAVQKCLVRKSHSRSFGQIHRSNSVSESLLGNFGSASWQL